MDVDPSERMLAVGGAASQLRLYRIDSSSQDRSVATAAGDAAEAGTSGRHGTSREVSTMSCSTGFLPCSTPKAHKNVNVCVACAHVSPSFQFLMGWGRMGWPCHLAPGLSLSHRCCMRRVPWRALRQSGLACCASAGQAVCWHARVPAKRWSSSGEAWRHSVALCLQCILHQLPV